MQAANFDNWNPFILCAGILALFTAGVFILGSWKVTIYNYDVVFGEGQGQGKIFWILIVILFQKNDKLGNI